MFPLLLIDILGVLIGLYSIYLLFRTKTTTRGGKISDVLNLFLWGIVLMIVAFGITIIFVRLKLLPPLPLDIHHLLMTIGMIFFVLAAKKGATILKAE